MVERVDTVFLPAERAGHDTILSQRAIAERSSVAQFFNDYPEPALILNRDRQIVWANQAAMRLGADISPRFDDPRPGEFIGCVHACDAEGGCGTSRACSFCSVGRGFCGVIERHASGSWEESTTASECALEREAAGMRETLEFRLWIKRFEEAGDRFLAFTMTDISAGKRKAALERIFFHDIMNTAAGIATWLDLAKMEGEHKGEYLGHAVESSRRLIEEIQSQRTLTQAEMGDLVPSVGVADPERVLEQTVKFCMAFAENREISIDAELADHGAPFVTDEVLLKRVLTNLVKNAIEASMRGDRVSIEYARPGGKVRFTVRNRAALNDEQKARIFQRSFSTKGRDRGLGTYGAKLIAERYLGGSVSFTSSDGEGTAFSVLLPEEMPVRAAGKKTT
jgi:hypothetical protein